MYIPTIKTFSATDSYDTRIRVFIQLIIRNFDIVYYNNYYSLKKKNIGIEKFVNVHSFDLNVI